MKRLLSLILITSLLSIGSIGFAGEYILGPYDTIELEVINHPELKTKQTVTPDGQASLPLLGVVAVKGQTLKGLHEFLTESYSAYIEKPQLTISLTPKPIYIVQEDLGKNTWDVKTAKSVDEAKALTGLNPNSNIQHGDVYKVSVGRKPDWLSENWYKVITATAVIAGIYATLNR